MRRKPFLKIFWVVNLVTVGVCALLGARAAGHLLVPRTAPEYGRVPDRQRGRAPAPTQDVRDAKGIVHRNLFCSTCAPASPAEREGQPEPADEIRPTTLELRLIATLVGEEDPRWSFAAIFDVPAGRMRILGAGGQLGPTASILEIRGQSVLLSNQGRRELLSLSPVAGELGAGPGALAPPRLGAVTAPEAVTGVREVGEGRYEIERAALERVLSNTTLLASSAVIRPVTQNGAPAGFRLDRIRPGSIYATIGLRNGDLVQAVNGHSMKSPDDALQVLTSLRRASHISVSFARGSRAMTQDYTIR